VVGQSPKDGRQFSGLFAQGHKRNGEWGKETFALSYCIADRIAPGKCRSNRAKYDGRWTPSSLGFPLPDFSLVDPRLQGHANAAGKNAQLLF
jgi:hypothetical protein